MISVCNASDIVTGRCGILFRDRVSMQAVVQGGREESVRFCSLGKWLPEWEIIDEASGYRMVS